MTLEGQGSTLQVMGWFNGGLIRIVRSGAEKSSFPTHVAVMTVVKIGLRSGAPAQADRQSLRMVETGIGPECLWR